MTKERFHKMTERRPLLLDGATGSYLKTKGMPAAGVCTEQWAYEHPEAVAAMQKAYADAGSDIIYAPTFGANRISLGNLQLQDRTEEWNRVLVERTRQNVGDRVLVAGDLSTTGQAMEPYGTMNYDTLLGVYREQIQALSGAGADLLVAETLISADEAVVICDAAREICDLPLLVSFTCEGDGSLYLGGSVYEAAAAMEAMGADAVGVNCSVGPDQLGAVIAGLHETVSIPVMAKPNAGMPVITEKGEAVYSMKAEEFARHLEHLYQCGATILGGCCGTTPEYIREIKTRLQKVSAV